MRQRRRAPVSRWQLRSGRVVRDARARSGRRARDRGVPPRPCRWRHPDRLDAQQRPLPRRQRVPHPRVHGEGVRRAPRPSLLGGRGLLSAGLAHLGRDGRGAAGRGRRRAAAGARAHQGGAARARRSTLHDRGLRPHVRSCRHSGRDLDLRGAEASRVGRAGARHGEALLEDEGRARGLDGALLRGRAAARASAREGHPDGGVALMARSPSPSSSSGTSARCWATSGRCCAR